MGLETHKDFDQIVKSKLQQYEVMPPDDIWAGIQDAGIDIGAAKSSNWKWWAAASALALFMLASSYLYLNQPTEDTSISQTKQIEAKANLSAQETTDVTVVEDDKTKSNNLEQSEITEKEVLKEMEETAFVEEEAVQQINKIANPNNNKVDKKGNALTETSHKLTIEPKPTIENTQEGVPKSMTEQKELAKLPNQDDASAPANKEDKVSPTKAGKDFFDQDAIDEATNGHLYDKYWVFGIEFSPEWITIPDNNNNIESYGLDLSARYQFSQFFFETGLGMAFSKDNGDYDVDYQEALFKGSYEDVYNVTFEIVNGNEIPTYYTKTVNVYDTIDRVSISENKNSYAYLNVPLNFGYYTRLNDHFSFYAKLGLNAGFKIYEDIPAPKVTGENVTIIKVTPRYFNRTSWNLQSQISLGINYHITEKFLFGVEPNARYYIKSLVEDNPGGNPYGLGVKLGFKYVFK